jgi:hypothetical protein
MTFRAVSRVTTRPITSRIRGYRKVFAAGHNAQQSDSELRIRFVDSQAVSHTVLDWTTILGNQSTDPDQDLPVLDFRHHIVNIASFAGKTVTVFFEQGDNGPGNNEQVYLDNIWFH